MPEDKRQPPEIPEGLPPMWFKPQLRTLKSARRTLARVIREWAAGTITPEDARLMSWLMNGLLGYFKESASTDLADRMAVIEKKLKKLEAPNGESKTFPRIERN